MRTPWVVALMCVAAGCPGTPKSSAGQTRETAVPVNLDPASAAVVVASPHTKTPHWYRVTVSQPSYLSASVPGNDALAIAVLRADGTEVDGKSVVTGDIAIRVTGPAAPYQLTVVVTPEPPPRLDVPECDLYNIDPQNPRCAGVVACDPNNPDFKNPVCCSLRCLRGPCSYEIVASDDGPDGIYAWIGAGAATGIVRGMYGTAEVRMRDGSVKTIPTSVKHVERDRAKIYVGPDSDQSGLLHWIVRLELPMDCVNATRPR